MSQHKTFQTVQVDLSQ